MPRPRSLPREEVLKKAMMTFWTNGFEGTSISDLVAATGSTRQSLYGDFGSKDGLYQACFDVYRDQVVMPALKPFETQAAGSDALRAYFETQISLAQEIGLPGPGCLVGNAMTETAPANPNVRQCVADHNARLERAFVRALPNTLLEGKKSELARFLVVAAQGLWAMSRVTASGEDLRVHARTIVRLVERDIENAD